MMRQFIKDNKEKIIRIVVFLTLLSIYVMACIFITQFKNDKINELTKNIISTQEQAFNATYDKYKTISKIIFDTHLNSAEVKAILKNNATNQVQGREELYALLKPTYKVLKDYNIGQIHFHNYDNTSFLRMDNPEKYGDNLHDFRYSVDMVNHSSKPFESFEIGIYMYGYRFVYPLNIDNKHFGSAEVSVSIEAFLKSFQTLYQKNVFFLLSKQQSNAILDKNEKLDFISSPLENFYFINPKVDTPLQYLSKKDLVYVNTEIEKGVPFTFLTNTSILSFIPIKNYFTKNIDGVYFLFLDNSQIQSVKNSFAWLLIFITLLLFFILYVLDRFNQFRISLVQKTTDIKKILDNQEAIVVVTDGTTIKGANQKLYDFIGFKNFEEFKSKYFCICELFEYEEGENYIQMEMEGLLWNEYLMQYKEKIHYVQMSGADEEKHIFQISISDFEEYQLVNFYDITKQKELEKRLNDINKNLEVHIAEEIEKNRKKDIVIQQQIRLAQMGEMISMIAHHWRQPLATLSSSTVTIKLKLLLKKYDFDTKEGQKSFLDTLNKELDDIENVVERLTSTIDDFRNFYKSSEEIEEVLINNVLEKAIASIDIHYPDENIKIIKSYSSKSKVAIYQTEVFQVFFNILINSIENFNKKGIENRMIKIESEDQENAIQIKISDNGEGIAPEIIDKIFDPYFSTKENKNDTGLGLYASKITIERNHLGTLVAYNTEEGVCFCITLQI